MLAGARSGWRSACSVLSCPKRDFVSFRVEPTCAGVRWTKHIRVIWIWHIFYDFHLRWAPPDIGQPSSLSPTLSQFSQFSFYCHFLSSFLHRRVQCRLNLNYPPLSLASCVCRDDLLSFFFLFWRKSHFKTRSWSLCVIFSSSSLSICRLRFVRDLFAPSWDGQTNVDLHHI